MQRGTLPFILSLLLTGLVVIVNSDCECGYAVNSTSALNHEVFTDLLESDFQTIQNVSLDTDWKVQRYYTDYNSSSGYYGKITTAENIISNPLQDNATRAGNGILGGDAGLQLWVRGGIPSDGLVPSAEIKTVRKDMLYGSFRIAAKLSPINGTCSAFFSYYNDTQEIDVELLSRQYMNYTLSESAFASPIDLVLHSIQSIEAGYQMPNTSTYGQPVLPVSLTNGFHEYRFDWTPGLVSFYFDGVWIWDLINDVPVMPSAVILSHWSNGAPGWSQGPPDEDAVLTVSYFKAYFNSSDPSRLSDYQGCCKDPSASRAICQVPDQKGPPDPKLTVGNQSNATGAANSSDGTYFFSSHSNQTKNQSVYQGADSSTTRIIPLWYAPGLESFLWSGLVIIVTTISFL